MKLDDECQCVRVFNEFHCCIACVQLTDKSRSQIKILTCFRCHEMKREINIIQQNARYLLEEAGREKTKRQKAHSEFEQKNV